MTPRSAAERGPRTAAVPEAPYDTEKGPTTQQVADSRFLERERASECDHGEGCICTELRHAGCCGALRTNVLASLATAAVPLDVERLARAFRLTFRSRYHERFAKPLAAEYARLSADEEGPDILATPEEQGLTPGGERPCGVGVWRGYCRRSKGHTGPHDTEPLP